MSRLRIGLIGCGRIAQRFHLPVLATLEGVQLAAVAESDPSRREACRNLAPKVPLFSDFSELLEGGGVDAVVICLPPALHADAAVASFERGLHVYLEKPLAITVEDGIRVVAAWRRATTVGRLGFNFRFHPLISQLREAVGSGALGEVIGARTVFCAARRVLPEWKRERRSGGGVLLELVSHHFDLVRFLIGQEITEVNAMLRSTESEADTATVELHLEAGPLVTVLASLAAIEDDRIEIYGTHCQLAFDRYRSSRLRRVPAERDFRAAACLRAAGAVLASLPYDLLDAIRLPREQSFARALAAFASAVRGRASAGPDLDDGLRSLAIVAAAEQAAARAQTVRVQETSLVLRDALSGTIHNPSAVRAPA